MGHIFHSTDVDFESDVLNAELPVLVDLWAEWCGPCKMIAPILEEASAEYEGRLKIGKLNVDENQRIPAKFNVRSIPTLLLFKHGELVAQKVGALSKSALSGWLNAHLPQAPPA